MKTWRRTLRLKKVRLSKALLLCMVYSVSQIANNVLMYRYTEHFIFPASSGKDKTCCFPSNSFLSSGSGHHLSHNSHGTVLRIYKQAFKELAIFMFHYLVMVVQLLITYIIRVFYSLLTRKTAHRFQFLKPRIAASLWNFVQGLHF